jgi:hypothetical protein
MVPAVDRKKIANFDIQQAYFGDSVLTNSSIQQEKNVDPKDLYSKDI